MNEADQQDLSQPAGAPGFVERRRPGRLQNPSPELIALMRAPSRAREGDLVAGLEARRLTDGAANPPGGRDDLSAATGIALGAVLGTGLWAAILGAAALLF